MLASQQVSKQRIKANVFIGENDIGWVAERFIAPVLKTGDVERRPWVRIPPHPLAQQHVRCKVFCRFFDLIETWCIVGLTAKSIR